MNEGIPASVQLGPEPVAYCGTEKYSTSGFTIKLFIDTEQVGTILYFLRLAHWASCHTLSRLFEVYEDMILLGLKIFVARNLGLNVCSVVRLSARKPVCSSTIISSL